MYCILYAPETNPSSKIIIDDFGQSNEILIRSYSLTQVKELYTKTIDRLSLSFGLALPAPNATNFRCYLRLAFDFEMIVQTKGKYHLTQNGKDYITNFNLEIDCAVNLSAVNLSVEQKKILLRVITNGNWTPHKVNIYWFLRYMEVTGGDWLPNRKDFSKTKLDLVNSLLKVNYNTRTMYEFLNFACNWCEELGLVCRIRINSDYDKLFLTPLGVEINNIFSLDLHIKKSRLNLSFQYIQ